MKYHNRVTRRIKNAQIKQQINKKYLAMYSNWAVVCDYGAITCDLPYYDNPFADPLYRKWRRNENKHRKKHCNCNAYTKHCAYCNMNHEYHYKKENYIDNDISLNSNEVDTNYLNSNLE